MSAILHIFILIFSTQLLAAENIGKSKTYFKIDTVSIKGAKKVEPAAILEKITLKKGDIASSVSVREAIRTIYSMKYFESVEAHQVGDKTLEIRVKEKPIISRIVFDGNDEVGDDDLKEQIKTKEYNILDVNSIKSDIVLLQKYYEDKGYFLADINYELIKNESGNLDVEFQIKEFDKVRVKKIIFLGNNKLEDSELKAFMQTREESLFSGMSGSGNFKEFNFKTDIERLKYLYKTKGHLQINVGNPSITVTEDKKWIFITVQIVEGPQFDVNNVFYNGELLFSQSEMEEKTTLRSGDTYSEETLRSDIQALTEMYQDKGYAFANVLRTLQIVPGENKVDINYSFEKGEIAYFGKVSVKGNNKTRDKVVRRELRIHEGMRYSGSKLRRSKENVNRLGFFEPQSVFFNTVSPKGKNNILDVEISVKERQTGQISVGAGYSTATKGFFQASIAQNNFQGKGQNLNLNVSFAESQKTYNLGFTEPYFLDSKWTAGADIYSTQNNLIDSFGSKKDGVDARVGYPIFEYTRLFMTLRHEVTKIDEVRNPTVDVNIENGVGASLQFSIRHDKRNNVFEPTDGHYENLSVEYAGLYGDQQWMKAAFEARYYKPLWDELTFRSRLRAEQLIKTTKRALPRTEKFQMGGSRNMRGYSFEDIGPQTYDQDKISDQYRFFNKGGTFSFLTSFELEHPLIKEAGLKWVLFYDVGNVFEDALSDDFEGVDLRADYGFGFRWFSPIGVLRFEFGYPVEPREGEDGQQFHFDIGQLF